MITGEILKRCSECGEIENYTDTGKIVDNAYHALRKCKKCGHESILYIMTASHNTKHTTIDVPPPPEYVDF